MNEQEIYRLSDELSGGYGHLALHYSGQDWQAVAITKSPRRPNRWVQGRGRSADEAMAVLLGQLRRLDRQS